MMRLILGITLAVTVGCTSITPVGPLAKMGGHGKPRDKDEQQEPITIPPVKPTPPLNYVGPGDVSPVDPHAAAQMLMSELEGDRKTISTAPTTAEVSKIRGGMKAN